MMVRRRRIAGPRTSPRLSSHRRHGFGPKCSWAHRSMMSGQSPSFSRAGTKMSPRSCRPNGFVNLSMRTGEVLTLNLYLTHHCKETRAIMLWGGDGEFSRDSISRAP